jgi:hypothetical protein
MGEGDGAGSAGWSVEQQATAARRRCELCGERVCG